MVFGKGKAKNCVREKASLRSRLKKWRKKKLRKKNLRFVLMNSFTCLCKEGDHVDQ